ncbi:MAG TPA: hypothetical protein VGI79_00930 [Caulobacteraceae bacterium]|jgi:hypothetical protein
MEAWSAATAAKSDAVGLDAILNQDCFCIDVDATHVWRALDQAGAADGVGAALAAERAHLFSNAPVFAAKADVDAMAAIVGAIETVSRLQPFQAEVLAWAPDIARLNFGPRGAFMGYDFHLTPDGPKLIEVNTNAGGAFLNAVLAEAQVACCPEVQALAPRPLAVFEDAVWDMFQDEWSRQGRSDRIRVLAIVDDAPQAQYLYPEFLLAKALFERRGVEAVIADPKDLCFHEGQLWLGQRPIDLVYNRLTDFALAGTPLAALREAYIADAVVVTPNPRHHAILADKRNLALLSDPQWLKALGVGPALRASLASLPRTQRVSADNAASLWAERRSLFFKPAGGHAGKAVYRGDKLTRSAWQTILQGDYVAQAFAAPSQRRVRIDGDPQARKMDVRLYAYDGAILLTAARLYQGQTTNFRTPGGGFAPVITLDCA